MTTSSQHRKLINCSEGAGSHSASSRASLCAMHHSEAGVVEAGGQAGQAAGRAGHAAAALCCGRCHPQPSPGAQYHLLAAPHRTRRAQRCQRAPSPCRSCERLASAEEAKQRAEAALGTGQCERPGGGSGGSPPAFLRAGAQTGAEHAAGADLQTQPKQAGSTARQLQTMATATQLGKPCRGGTAPQCPGQPGLSLGNHQGEEIVPHESSQTELLQRAPE